MAGQLAPSDTPCTAGVNQPHRVLFCGCKECLALANSWLQQKEQQIDANAVKHLAAAAAAAGTPVESDDKETH
jgi:hypothetical protein